MTARMALQQLLVTMPAGQLKEVRTTAAQRKGEGVVCFAMLLTCAVPSTLSLCCRVFAHQLFTKMLSYNNVPIKPKTFKVHAALCVQMLGQT